MTRSDFPGESPGYRQRRQELFAAEIALRDQIERVAAMRRAPPLGMRMPDADARLRLSRGTVRSRPQRPGRMENDDGSQHPGVSVFSRDRDGAVYHRYTVDADLDGKGRGIDLYSPVWQVCDLLPSGRGDWYPSHADMVRAAVAHA